MEIGNGRQGGSVCEAALSSAFDVYCIVTIRCIIVQILSATWQTRPAPDSADRLRL